MPNFAYELCVRKILPAQRASLDLSSWTLAYNGSEPVKPEMIARFSAYFAPCGFRRASFYPCYGLAEATLFVSSGSKAALPVVHEVERSDGHPGKIVGCGHAYLGQFIVIADPEAGVRCAPDTPGEIWLAGPCVTQGYWNRSEETECLPCLPGARYASGGGEGTRLAGPLCTAPAPRQHSAYVQRQDPAFPLPDGVPASKPGRGGKFPDAPLPGCRGGSWLMKQYRICKLG